MGLRVAEVLSSLNHTLEIVVTRGAIEVAKYEENIGEEELLRTLSRYGKIYDENDYSSPLASSSNAPEAMIIAPASMKTVALIANGLSINLVSRAALSMLRLGRPLVVAPRETPMGIAELRNLLRLASMGARIVPLCIAFYHRPQSLDDMVDFLAGKILDTLGIENNLYKRWGSSRSP